MTALQDKAEEMSRAFEGATRPDGSEYRRLREGSPAWMADVVREAHAGATDFLPDDWRYVFAERSCDALAEFEGTDDAFDSLEPDVYTSALTAWLSSHNGRLDYCDDAYREYGDLSRYNPTFSLLQLGQLAEMREVCDLVRQALESRITGMDASADD